MTREDAVAINAKKGALVELIRIQSELEAAAPPLKDALPSPAGSIIDFVELRKTFPCSFGFQAAE